MKHMIFTEQKARPIENGDAGVIFTKEGGFYIFSTGAESPDKLTEVQTDQAIIIDALHTALKVPGVVAMLVKMSNDPKVISGIELLERQERAAAH